jgi:pyroglutamyl-peptidase
MAKPRVLVTGFGPFPGVAENPSGWLAETLAARAQTHPREVHARVLPTEWAVVGRLVPSLLDEISPRVILHFGVSQQSKSFRIERYAHNIAAARADACGALPQDSSILPAGTDRLDSAVCAMTLARHLRTQGLPAAASNQAGHYLCNCLYYLSLDWAVRRTGDCLVCFVHIPPAAAQGGPLSEAELLRGADAILHHLLAMTAERDISCSTNSDTNPPGKFPCPSAAGT